MADVGHIDLSHDDRFVVFTANNGGFGKIIAYDRTNHQVKTVYDDEEYNLDWFNSAPFLITDDHQVIFSVANLYGAKLMKCNLLTSESEVMDSVIQEDMKNAMQFTKFTYSTTSDTIGVMTGIEAYMYKPASSPFDKMPVVIELHGGPMMPAFPYQIGLGHYFIDKGIAMISPNYRGSAGYGVSFEASDNLRNRYKQVEDIKALHDWIKTQPDLDSDKVYLMGASHGGYMVMAALSQFPGLFVGGMSLAGVSDNSLVMHKNNYHAKSWKHEFGDFSDPLQRPMLDSISPLYSAHRIAEPLLLIHGTADSRVVYQNSDKMADAIDAAGGRVHYMKLVGSGHAANPEGPLEALYMMSVTFGFIEELLID